MTKEEYLQLKMLKEIDRKVSKQNWFLDFSSNIAGNAVWDVAVWIGRRLIRKL